MAEGTDTIVATPHVRFDLGTTDAAEILHRVCELRAVLAAFSLPLEVHCGGELGHDVVGSFSQYELELLAQGPPDARWLLVEAPFEGIGVDFHAAGRGAARARLRRAHRPPRTQRRRRSLDGARGLRRELEAGSLAQLNAQSLTGEHGADASAAAWRLIREGRVAVVASDAHGPTRPPRSRRPGARSSRPEYPRAMRTGS